MKKHTDPQIQLEDRLDSYTATVRTSTIANALKHTAEKWPVYAAVTGAAMAMASNASASIIYSGLLNETAAISTGQRGLNGGRVSYNSRNIALGNGDNFTARVSNSNSGGLGIADIDLNGNGMKFLLAPGSYVKHLSSGAKISGSGHNANSTSGFVGGRPLHLATLIDFGGGQNVRGWLASGKTQGFAGFYFNTANQQRDYGWVRLQYTIADHVKVVDWAYDNTGLAIRTGEESNTPEPCSMALMLLAAGAAGVEALRRRSEAAKK